MRKDDVIRVRHMLDAARNAMTFAEGKSRTDLDQNLMLTFALVRAIELIGEAASKVSRNSQEKCHEVPWPQIIGMRHRLIHGYDDINLDILWETVTIALPQLAQALRALSRPNLPNSLMKFRNSTLPDQRSSASANTSIGRVVNYGNT